MVRAGFGLRIGMGDDGQPRPTGHSQHQNSHARPRDPISNRSFRGGPNLASSSASSSQSLHLTGGQNIGRSGGAASVGGGGALSGGSAAAGAGGSPSLPHATAGGALWASSTVFGGDGGMALRRGMAAFWASYNMSLAARPLFTKCVTGVVGTVLGDLIAQLSSHALFSTPTEGGTAIAADPPRLGRIGRGSGVGGGSGFGAIEDDRAYTAGKDKDKERQRETEEGGGRRFKYDVQRVLRLCLWSVVIGTPLAHYWFRFLDTRIMAQSPTSNAAVVSKLLLDQLVMSPAGTALFFFGFRLLEGGTLRDARSSVAAKWAPTMALNYVLWPAANIVNFKFVPPEQRILYVNCVALFWSAIMSHMANRKEQSSAAAAVAAAVSPGADSSLPTAVAFKAAGDGGRGLLSARARGLTSEPSGVSGEGAESYHAFTRAVK